MGSVYSRNSLQTSDAIGNNAEISGISFSSKYVGPSGQPILYGINDKGNGERLVLWDSGTGARLRTFSVPHVVNVDWEDLTIGTCGHFNEDASKNSKRGSSTCLYIMDTGDNTARESRGTTSDRNGVYYIIKLHEPKWSDYADYAVLPSSSVSILSFNYSHSTSPTKYADSESAFLDHTGWGGGTPGDLYVITKWGGRKNRLFRVPVAAWESAVTGKNATGPAAYAPAAVGNYDNTKIPLLGEPWLRADMTGDGTVIALGGESWTRLFLRCPGQSVAEALTPVDYTQNSLVCYDWNSESEQNNAFESFAWTPDGKQNLQVIEGLNSPMEWTDMTYDQSEGNNRQGSLHVCPDLVLVDGICQDESTGQVYPSLRCEEGTPSVAPTKLPTLRPTQRPSLRPTPTEAPTVIASQVPTVGSSLEPTVEEENAPVVISKGMEVTTEELPTSTPIILTSSINLDKSVQEHGKSDTDRTNSESSTGATEVLSSSASGNPALGLLMVLAILGTTIFA